MKSIKDLWRRFKYKIELIRAKRALNKFDKNRSNR